MIDSERDYADERLCGVNDMIFEEWERYQDYMIKYYGGYFSDGLYEYEDHESNKGDDSSEEDESSDEDDENRRSCPCNNDLCLSRVTSPGWHPGQNDDHVCLCDPTDFNAGTCCCNYLGLECNGQCRPDGYDRWLYSREPINH